MKISTCVLMSALSLSAAELKLSSKFFNWYNEGDPKPRVVPNMDLSVENDGFSMILGSQLLGYGHQLGDLHLGFKIHGGLDYSVAFYKQLYSEFPSRGFRSGTTGFGPEGFIIGGGGPISYYRFGTGKELPYLDYFLGLEDGYNDPGRFTKAIASLRLKHFGLSSGIEAEMFVANLMHEKHRIKLGNKVFDVHRAENPVYFTVLYSGYAMGANLSISGAWLLSQDMGTKFGQCGCINGQTDGFSPDFAKFKLGLSATLEIGK